MKKLLAIVRTELLCYNKSRMRYLLLIVLSITLTGCFATTHELKTKFNPKDANPSYEEKTKFKKLNE